MDNCIPFSALQKTPIGWEFEGCQFNNTDLTFIIVEAPPGTGPRLHQHPYTEVFIVQEGKAIFSIGKKQVVVQGGQILIVPPFVPHKFLNTGTGILKQVDIHLSAKFSTEWLED